MRAPASIVSSDTLSFGQMLSRRSAPSRPTTSSARIRPPGLAAAVLVVEHALRALFTPPPVGRAALPERVLPEHARARIDRVERHLVVRPDALETERPVPPHHELRADPPARPRGGRVARRHRKLHRHGRPLRGHLVVPHDQDLPAHVGREDLPRQGKAPLAGLRRGGRPGRGAPAPLPAARAREERRACEEMAARVESHANTNPPEEKIVKAFEAGTMVSSAFHLPRSWPRHPSSTEPPATSRRSRCSRRSPRPGYSSWSPWAPLRRASAPGWRSPTGPFRTARSTPAAG